jgi:hypothetical protein
VVPSNKYDTSTFGDPTDIITIYVSTQSSSRNITMNELELRESLFEAASIPLGICEIPNKKGGDADG